jgi:hypothetical protein
MTQFSDETVEILNLALADAIFHGCWLTPNYSSCLLRFAVPNLSLIESGVPLGVQVRLGSIQRIAASRRDSETQDTLDMSSSTLADTLNGFTPCEVYESSFLDRDYASVVDWLRAPSIDISFTRDKHSHTFDLFVESHREELEVRFWFSEFGLFDPKLEPIDIDAFIESSLAWSNYIVTHKPVITMSLVPPAAWTPLTDD